MLSDFVGAGSETFVLGGTSTVNNQALYNYNEYTGSASERYTQEGAEVVRIFDVPWASRQTFLDYLLGYTTADGTSTLKRILPEPHAEFITGTGTHPYDNGLYATEAEVIPQIGATGYATVNSAKVPAYTYARIRVTYRPRDWRVKTDADVGSNNELQRYITRQYTYVGEYITFNGKMIFVSSPKNTLTTAPGKITTSLEMTYIWRQIPYGTSPYDNLIPNIQTIEDCTGKVNSATFDDLFEAGTVLFLGVDQSKLFPTVRNNRRYWDMHFKFLLRRNGAAIGSDTVDAKAGHNYVWNNMKTPSGFDLCTSDGTNAGNRIYDRTDLAALFNPATI